jgi:hypothetical protein
MSTTAIAGVSPQREAVVTSVWPSVAATGLGRFIGILNDCIPVRINGIKLSVMLFALPMLPLALTIYLLQKVAGVRYRLTNKSIQQWSSLGSRMIKSVPLTSVDQIRIVKQNGQEFFHAGDIELVGADGGILMRMYGIPYPEGFKKNLQETQSAASQTAASLLTIQKRAK